MPKNTKTPKRELLAALLVIEREEEQARVRVDQRLDDELQDTFPASDALSVTRGR
jgi:hypothetical protein